MLTALTDGRRYSHVERLLEDPTILELFGMESAVSDDTVRRFFKSLDPVLGAVFTPCWGAWRISRLCPAYRFRSGDTVTATQWKEAMEDAQRWLGEREVWLNPGDLGLGHDGVMAWHEERSGWPKFLFKLKLTHRGETEKALVPAHRRPPRPVGPADRKFKWPFEAVGPNVTCACTTGSGRIAPQFKTVTPLI